MFAKRFGFLGLIAALLLTGCAKRGTITGGLKDTLSPVLRNSLPKNFATDFKGNTIRLTFDEYIKLKDINKQLIVSPPMNKAPEVTPSTASKYLNIKIKDTLLPNTTYSFNFGQSIQDNNEGNPYPQFKYVFSTGPYIDSLALNGRIKDALEKKTDNFVTVMLYEANDKYNDSIVYKTVPRYVTNTLDSATTFRLENLKAGKYKLVAMTDSNSNYKFNPATEKIGFHTETITIPTDTVYEIELFKEIAAFKSIKPTQASGNRLLLGYEGNPKDVKVTIKKGGQTIESIITPFSKKDSLQIWYKPIQFEAGSKTDSLQINVSKGNYNSDFSIRIKNQKADTLSIAANFKDVLPLREKFALQSSVPIVKTDLSKIQLFNKDSVAVAFQTIYDDQKQELGFAFAKEPLQKYQLRLLPGALTDFLENTNDTLAYKLETKNLSEYGNLTIKLENVKQFPIIVELTNNKGEILYSAYSEDSAKIDFNLINPALLTLRVIYDTNKNKAWDTGSFLGQRQTEQVIYFPKEIDVRANWDVEQTFNLAAP